MKTIKILRDMEKLGKPYYTPADMSKITLLKETALKVRLNRLKKEGVIESIGRGMYKAAGTVSDPEKAANDAVYPSYISFRSALSKTGIISEVPYVLEFATTKPTRRKKIGNIDVLYRKIKKILFFGYRLEKGVFIAEPEKAFLDLLYFAVYGKDRDFNAAKMDMSKLDMKKVSRYAARFPEKVGRAVKRIKSRAIYLN